MPELIREVVSSLAARVFFQLQRRCRGISALMRQPHVLAMVVSALPLECTAFCCKECKHSSAIAHGHRCGDRQEPPTEPQAEPTPSPEDLQVQYLKALLEVCLPDLSLEDRRRWLRDVLRAFHSDRYPRLSGHHVCSQLLTICWNHNDSIPNV